LFSGEGGFVLEGDDVVARLHVGDTLADGLDDTSTLVSQNNGESTLGVLSGQCVRIFFFTLLAHITSRHSDCGSPTCVADTSVVDLDSHFVSLGRGDLDVLDAQVLAGLPGHGGLAGDGLFGGSTNLSSVFPIPSSFRVDVTLRGMCGIDAGREASHLAGGSSHDVSEGNELVWVVSQLDEGSSDYTQGQAGRYRLQVQAGR
jgi:hypothetical protein